jgi:hypothetical protein
VPKLGTDPFTVYPKSFLLYVPGSDRFWEGVVTGSGVVGGTAAVCLGLLLAPEVTIPVLSKCYAK